MKTPSSESGFFNSRALFALALCSVGVGLAMLSFAAPTAGSIARASSNAGGDLLFVDKHAAPLSSNSTAAAAGGWAIVTSPNTSSTQSNFLSGVTCVSASDCWAVGFYYTGSAYTLIEQWNGTSWAIITSPNYALAAHNYLFGVTCVSASEWRDNSAR